MSVTNARALFIDSAPEYHVTIKVAPMNAKQHSLLLKEGVIEMATEQNRNDNPQQNSPDYEKPVKRQPEGTGTGREMANDRDLGSVGGGSVPSSGPPQGGMNTSNSTVDSGGNSTGARTGSGSPTDRGGSSSTGMNSSTSSNAVDPHAQSNIGGRNPGQPQTAMGEQDSRGQRDSVGDPTADPMCSRTPGGVQQQKDRDQQEQQQKDQQ